ncbi:MAG: hypothetical protein ACPGOV_04350 [Magnetovibrionaceae bacterium]
MKNSVIFSVLALCLLMVRAEPVAAEPAVTFTLFGTDWTIDPGERAELGLILPDGWRKADTLPQAGASREVYYPEGQDRTAWSERLVLTARTVDRGYRAQAPVNEIVRKMQSACGNFQLQDQQMGTVSGYQTIRFSLFCEDPAPEAVERFVSLKPLVYRMVQVVVTDHRLFEIQRQWQSDFRDESFPGDAGAIKQGWQAFFDAISVSAFHRQPSEN